MAKSGEKGEMEQEIVSVRDLDDWVPSARGNSSGKSSARPAFYIAPPTERLYLNLDNVGHGKTAEQAMEFRKLRERFSKQRQSVCRSNRRKDNDGIANSINNTVIAGETTGGNKSKFVSPSSYRDHDVIVSNIKRTEEISREEKPVLDAQLKVLDRLSARCRGPNQQASMVHALFKQCQPDEFGYVIKDKFLSKVGEMFKINRGEAEKLFNVGHKEGGKTNKEAEELNYLQFRDAFKRLDNSTTFIPATYRPILNREAAPVNSIGKASSVQVQSKSGKFLNMTLKEREEYRKRSKIAGMLEHGRRKMQDAFITRVDGIQNNKVDNKLGQKNVMIRTRLSFPEVANFFQEFGVDMSADTVRDLCREHPSEESITFSQLVRRIDGYFSKLDSDGEDVATGGDGRAMELKGVFLGCRALSKGDEHTSSSPDFLAHRSTPERKQRPSSNSSLDFNKDSNDAFMSKARWTDKTLDAKPRKRCGNNILATVTETSDKMQKGNGNILQWTSKDTYEDHPLYKPKEFSACLETGRLETGRLDTSRSLNSSCFTTPIITTPWGTDRDLR